MNTFKLIAAALFTMAMSGTALAADLYVCMLTTTTANAEGALQGKQDVDIYQSENPSYGFHNILKDQVGNLPIRFSSYRDTSGDRGFYTRISLHGNAAEAQSLSRLKPKEASETTLFVRIPTQDPNVFIISVTAQCLWQPNAR